MASDTDHRRKSLPAGAVPHNIQLSRDQYDHYGRSGPESLSLSDKEDRHCSIRALDRRPKERRQVNTLDFKLAPLFDAK
jgi:hypothetical protein